ncbi:MAG: cytochrome d ubiquinol oxidase subunit II [Sulfobacillus thermosulfidooxidans]|uniref:cytochrome d ubiquinol oxidase subunit II n=1 Tax=Sulfobacillus sp. hq2 TaxID=2039167 RepID=UPI000CD272EB|nr:cytochrome d ubiquinol oxidase subunit II [Sulfobacillus sp. hq2]POB11678.1 cytochrome d ubiquinol oxidase subunit II [Sulfobacillus sp. hq2]PSR37438.1 MAG: cytochrome d ubiquinol oxidase subunit II [Sulfobacillus thermosulfidooxidans]
MWLQDLWFVLVAVLFVGYFILDGFDYGVGILHPFINRTDLQKRASLSAIAPVWAANEVWLVAAGGALFAAFPQWYATMFSGFYLALTLVLLGLIVRGVGIEYRSQDRSPRWRSLWDWLIFSGSLVITLIWGMAFANLIRGVPINAHKVYVGNFGTLFNGFALWGGLTFILLFVLHSAGYLAIKGDAGARKTGKALEGKMLWPTVLVMGVWFVWMDRLPASNGHVGVWTIGLQVVSLMALLLAWIATYVTRSKLAFFLNSASVAAMTVSLFTVLFPRVMVSSLNPLWNLTVSNASATTYTLQIMSVTAVILLPIILGYQTWIYWTFRKPVNDKELEY